MDYEEFDAADSQTRVGVAVSRMLEGDSTYYMLLSAVELQEADMMYERRRTSMGSTQAPLRQPDTSYHRINWGVVAVLVLLAFAVALGLYLWAR